MNAPAIAELKVGAFKVPIDPPESDGTLAWDATGCVVVEVRAGDTWGLGYSYTHPSVTQLVRDMFAPALEGMSAFETSKAWGRMRELSRNAGHPGLVAMGISAVDIALWDLKAKLLDVPLPVLFGGTLRRSVPVYGSGGFTSWDLPKLKERVEDWVRQGVSMVKIKLGREPGVDVDRVRTAREAIGPDRALFVDANGAYHRKQAVLMGTRFAEYGVCWYEEPVSSDDLDGLRFVRDHVPPVVQVTAGEYGWDLFSFERMLRAGAVDVMQVDVTRAQGYTGALQVSALCQAHSTPVSSHCAPAATVPLLACLPRVLHLEYFRDHVCIEPILFDGAPKLEDGALLWNDRPGHGLTLRRSDVDRYAV